MSDPFAQTSPLRSSETFNTAPFELDIISGPPAFSIEWAVRLDRLKKRKCARCRNRRIVYALRGYAGSAVIASSPVLCARCAGLVR